MKTLRYLSVVGLLLVLGSCFKDVSYNTDLILRPSRQTTTGGLFDALEGVTAFVCNVDTTLWTVTSYEDALAGIVRSKANPTEIALAEAVSESYQEEGSVGWVSLPLRQSLQMVVVVDTEDRIYAYTQQKLEVNLPKLYIDLPFRVWKEGRKYRDGNWVFCNDFYEEPLRLQCVVSPSVQVEQQGEQTALTKAEVYAFYADTTEWYVASYEDALSRRITRKDDPTKTRTTPETQGFLNKETETYKMEVRNPVLMLIVVDKSSGSQRYAYSKQQVDLAGAPVNFPVLFQMWRSEYLYVEQGWRIVNQTLKPTEPEIPTPSNNRNR